MKAFVFVALLALANAQKIAVSRSCAAEEDKTAVGRCLRPWLNMWETMRAQEAISSELHFPVLYYSRAGVLGLCERYLQIKDDCLSRQILHTCRRDPMIAFVESHMSYFCGNDATFALSRWDCVSKAVESKTKCRTLIKGVPLPSRQSRKCLGIPKFYRCLAPELERRCGSAGEEILQSSIEAFGCSLNSEENVIPAAENREDRKMDALVKNMHIGKGLEVDDGAEVEVTSVEVEATEKPNSHPLFKIVEGNGRRGQRRRPTTVRPTSTTKESRGPGFVVIASSTEEKQNSKSWEIVEDPRNGTHNPWRNRTSGPGISLGGSSVDDKVVVEDVVEEPSGVVFEDGKDWAIVDDPRNGSHNPWRGRLHGSGLVVGDASRENRRGGLRTVSSISSGGRSKSSVSGTTPAPVQHRLYTVDRFQRKPVFTGKRGRGLIITDRQNTEVVIPVRREIVDMTPEELAAHELKTARSRAKADGSQVVMLGGSTTRETTEAPSTTAARTTQERTRQTSETTEETQPATTSTTTKVATSPGSTSASSSITTAESTVTTTTKAAKTTEAATEESTKATTTTATADAVFDLPTTASGVCTPESEEKIIQCLGPLSTRWDEIHTSTPALRKNFFPLFNYTADQTMDLCELLENTVTDCMSMETFTNCAEHDILKFVNNMLGFACGKEKQEFFLSFDCIHMSHERHIGCLNLLQGDNMPGLSTSKKCKKVPNYIACLRDDIDGRCGEDALRMWLQAVKHYGCEKGLGDIPAKPTVAPTKTTRPPTTKPATTTTTTRKSTTTTKASSAPRSTSSVPASRPPSAFVPVQPLIRSEADDSLCTDTLRHTARKCLLPLMEQWSAMVAKKEKLSLPHFTYGRAEWLELCDGYANAFLCGGFNPFQRCINDEFVRYANDHLGFVCSPQNLPKYIMNYDCITRSIRQKGTACTQFIAGQSTPGKDSLRCQGVSQFHACVTPDIQFTCGREATMLVEEVVTQYGCVTN